MRIEVGRRRPGAVVTIGGVLLLLVGIAAGAAAAGQTGDYDGDTDVDAADFLVFAGCLTGRNVGPPSTGCMDADIDHDLDVDHDDFGYFQRCLSGEFVPADPLCAWSANRIPPRPADAVTGSTFAGQVMNLGVSAREQRVQEEMTAGNIPPFLRNFVPVTVTATLGGAAHTATYFVMPDVLAIGADDDFFRMPMGPRTAQAIGDAFGCVMVTRKMSNDIYAAATVKLAPHPYSPTVYDIESVDVFYQSHQYIEGQRAAAGGPLGALIGGIKKDVVITALLATRPGKVAIYGWHQLNGQPIQPLYVGHVITYMDYSHGIRLVKNAVLVDGRPMLLTDLLKHPVLHPLVSDEGMVIDPRYH